MTVSATPTMNASTSADITPNSGGISSAKYGASSASSGLVSDGAPPSGSTRGRTISDVLSPRNPASSVDEYASAAVMANHRPAPRPSSAMAGAMRPRMINGMAKPRNWPNTPLNVTKTLVSQSGKKFPNSTPSAIATTIWGRSPNVNFFFWAAAAVLMRANLTQHRRHRAAEAR